MNDPGVLDFTIYRGDDFAHMLYFVDDQDPPEPLDVSDYTFTAQIRPRPNSSLLSAVFIVDDTAAAEGTIGLYLNSSQTAELAPGYWDLQVEYDTGFKKTWVKGKINMDGDVTKEVTT